VPATAIKATAIKTNVLRLRTGREVKIDDSPAAIALCQQEIFRSRWTYRRISIEAGVHHGTVQRIATGDTTRPAIASIARILMALGWGLIAREGKSG